MLRRMTGKKSTRRAGAKPKTVKTPAALPAPPPKEEAAPSPVVVSEEVYEILQLAQAGTPLEARRVFSAMVSEFYRYPRHESVSGGRQAQYEDVNTAFAACERHVADAVRVMARLRRDSDAEGGIDVMLITDAYRRMTEVAIRKLSASAAGPAKDFAILLTSTAAALKDAAAFFGKPLQHNVTVQGQISHTGLTSNPADAYSAWNGGTADLAGVVTDAEFTELPT